MEGVVKVGEEEACNFIEFRQLKTGPNTFLSIEDSIDASTTTSPLKIDNDGELAFWMVKDACTYAPLKELHRDGKVSGTLIAFKNINGLDISNGWLVLRSPDRIQMHEISRLNAKKDPIMVVSGVDIVQFGIGKENIVWLDKNRHLNYCKLGTDKINPIKTDKVIVFGLNKETGCIWTMDRDRVLRRIHLSSDNDKTGSKETSFRLPRELANGEDSTLALHVFDDHRLAISLNKTIYFATINVDSKSVVWTKFEDPTRSCTGPHGTSSCFLLEAIKGWSGDTSIFIVIADRSSPDIVCGAWANDEFKMFFLESEEGLPQLPLTKDGDVTFPIGMAMDFTDRERVQSKPNDPDSQLLPPQPILWILSSRRLVCPFRIVKTDQTEPHSSIKSGIEEINSREEVIPRVSSPVISTTTSFTKEILEVGANSLVDSEEENKAASTSLPLISILTEDFGLLNNAIIAEAVSLYDSFNQDLDQVRYDSDEIYRKIMKEKPSIDGLEQDSVKLSSTSQEMEELLRSAVRNEDRLKKLVTEMSSLELLGEQKDIKGFLEKLALAISRVRTMINEAESSGSEYNKRLEYLKTIVVPELERIIGLMPSNGLPARLIPSKKSGRSTHEDIRWKKLHQVLRQRNPKELLNYTISALPNPPKARTAVDPSSVCIPIPKPLVLAKTSLEPATIPDRVKWMAPIFSQAPDDSHAKSIQDLKGIVGSPTLTNVRLAEKIDSIKITDKLTIRTDQSIQSSLVQATELDSTTPITKDSVRKFSSLDVSVHYSSKSTEPNTMTIESKSSPNPSNVISATPADTSPIVSSAESPKKETLLDTDNADIKSPTPKGLKSPPSGMASVGFNFGSLSMNNETVKGIEEKDVENMTMAGPNVFSVPQIIPSTAKEDLSTETKADLTLQQSFGFRPSPLASVAPRPSNTNASTVPTFGSIQSLGLNVAQSQQPVFGQPAPLGQGTFGQTSSLGFRPSTSIGSLNTPNATTGFSAFASNTATNSFAAFVRPSEGGSIFGPASKNEINKNLPSSFTQFRS